jgi:hypothetical protein
MTRFLILSMLSIVIFGCASRQTVPFDQSKKEGQWEAKAQVRDLQKGVTRTVSLDILSVRNQALRMEVSGNMGVHVASFLLQGGDVSYAIHPQKTFFSGPVSEKSLRRLLNADIDPRWLYAIFFDEPLRGWECAGQPVEKCRRSDGTEVTWSERQGEKKRVTIQNSQYELQILVKDFATKVLSPERAFTLNSPETYRRYKLQ